MPWMLFRSFWLCSASLSCLERVQNDFSPGKPGHQNPKQMRMTMATVKLRSIHGDVCWQCFTSILPPWVWWNTFHIIYIMLHWNSCPLSCQALQKSAQLDLRQLLRHKHPWKMLKQMTNQWWAKRGKITEPYYWQNVLVTKVASLRCHRNLALQPNDIAYPWMSSAKAA